MVDKMGIFIFLFRSWVQAKINALNIVERKGESRRDEPPSLDKSLKFLYNAMIFEALSALKEPNGSDSSAIATFIEQRQEVPQNFKRVLTSRLRRLVQQNKLEKVQNCYRLKRDSHVDAKSPAMRQTDARPRQVQSIGYLGDTVEDAAISAAYKIAEAENKSFVAAEAVKEAERVSTMAEDMESLLQFATDCFDQSARGEIVLMA
ncbi:Telomere repeat-binding factor 4 [Sesamum angolense]|uniref:Telomere repeat-binding factor 4 n=1 Tax=Sesamum angolense TaxID=2727404 RepID=A0AAE2BND7_9LAMI|nr:Telomere repeat-binding factor 4 [Sesamum angolense]